MKAMSSPVSTAQSSKWVYLAVGVAVGLVFGFLLSGVLSTSSSPGSSTTSPPPAGVPATVSHTGVDTNATPVLTSPFDAPAGSLVLLFVSYINYEAGGGSPQLVTDSLGDPYTLLSTTGSALNHTESLFATTTASSDASLVATVAITGGATPQGGSVAAVDVSNANLGSIDSVSWNTGSGGTAAVTLTTSHSGDLFLFGAAGRGVSGPYSAGSGETLLDTGTADSGPFEDGTGYGTFTIMSSATTLPLSADLNQATFWDAIGIAIDPA
ncbi:MAG TPA: hypothetical protein VGG32_02380 [Thermoplasmata archaeon]